MCIFTIWRVGKRAFLRILQWENGKIRQKRAFSPSGEWENVHFCTFYSGKTAKYVKNVHFHPLESGKTCMFALHVAGAPRYRVHAKYVKTCIFTLWRVGKRAFLHILQWENGEIRQKRAFSPSGEWENVHFCTFYREKTTKYEKNVHFHPLESGKTCISAHSKEVKRRNTIITCIFTLWRVGKRAFLHILQRENGEIRQKRAFSPSGEWENVHFCTFYSGKTAKYDKNVHFHPLESGKTCISAHSTERKRRNTRKTCIFTLWRVGKRAFLHILKR